MESNKVFIVEVKDGSVKHRDLRFVAESVAVLGDVTEVCSSCGPIVHITRFPTALLKSIRVTDLKD
jgi:hypothetical protein